MDTLIANNTDTSRPIKLLLLAPAFHGHARPLWQLALELANYPAVHPVFLDCFSSPLDYPGDVDTLRIETSINSDLALSTKCDSSDIVHVMTDALADMYNKVEAPLKAFIAEFKPDVLVIDFFFSLGPILAKQFNLPYIIAYSTPDVFYIQQNAQSRFSNMELMVEKKKHEGYAKVMQARTGKVLENMSFSPYGNICFTPDIFKERNPSAFLEDDIVQGSVRWHQYRNFYDNQIYPVVGINHAMIQRPPSAEDEALAEFLKTQEKTSIIISFGTVWLKQLGDKNTEAAFVQILRGVLLATNQAHFNVLYSGDQAYLSQASADLALVSNVVQANYINQTYLLPYADLFVFHGGHNSFCEAMTSQTPMLIFPKGFDQGRVADLACQLGVGERISFSHNTEKIIAQKVEQLITNPAYQERLAKEKYAFCQPLNANYVLECIQHAIQEHLIAQASPITIYD